MGLLGPLVCLYINAEIGGCIFHADDHVKIVYNSKWICKLKIDSLKDHRVELLTLKAPRKKCI